MIRAVVRGETIQPLDPIPADWKDGREVVVQAVPVEEVDETWLADMDRLTAELGSPEDWAQIDAALAEADAAAKSVVRRQMGLD